jgi:hypothetical protein
MKPLEKTNADAAIPAAAPAKRTSVAEVAEAMAVLAVVPAAAPEDPVAVPVDRAADRLSILAACRLA